MNFQMKLIGVTLAGCLFLTACESNSRDNLPSASAEQTSAQGAVSSQPVAVPPADSGATSGEPAAEEVFYGTWTITSCLGTSEVYALSEEEKSSLIGTKLTYESNVYKNGSAAMDISGYGEESMDSDEFYTNFRIRFADIGIDADAASFVSIGAEGEFFGANFFVKDENALVVYYEGVFFEAVRT